MYDRFYSSLPNATVKNPAKYKKTRHIVPHLTRKDKYVKRGSRKAVPWAGGGNKD